MSVDSWGGGTDADRKLRLKELAESEAQRSAAGTKVAAKKSSKLAFYGWLFFGAVVARLVWRWVH